MSYSYFCVHVHGYGHEEKFKEKFYQ